MTNSFDGDAFIENAHSYIFQQDFLICRTSAYQCMCEFIDIQIKDNSIKQNKKIIKYCGYDIYDIIKYGQDEFEGTLKFHKCQTKKDFYNALAYTAIYRKYNDAVCAIFD